MTKKQSLMKAIADEMSNYSKIAKKTPEIESLYKLKLDKLKAELAQELCMHTEEEEIPYGKQEFDDNDDWEDDEVPESENY